MGINSIINARAEIGDGALINTGSIVEHDCIIENYAHIASGIKMGGKVKVGKGTLVGTGTIILEQVSIGEGCTIGAGSVVSRTIPEASTAYGCPAKTANNIFISTYAIQNSLEKIRSIDELQINLELGYNKDNQHPAEYLNQFQYNHGLIAHNYFLPPSSDFVLNLASQSESILEKSIEYYKEAIDFCAQYRIHSYGLHGGFCFEAEPQDLGKNQTELKRYPKQAAKQTFFQSIDILLAYAKAHHVELCVENNVVTKDNLVDGQNDLYLMSDASDFEELLNLYRDKGLKILCDLGHLNITAKTLGIDRFEFIDKLLPDISIIHLHDNNFNQDQHLPFTKNTWFMDLLPQFKDKHLVIELNSSATAQDIVKCYDALRVVTA